MAELARVEMRRSRCLGPKTTENDIPVALQFCSKRPVSNLTLTWAGLDEVLQ